MIAGGDGCHPALDFFRCQCEHFIESTADFETLYFDGQIKEVKNPVGLKVLGDGELTVALTVKANKFSKAAKEAIEKAGGTVEVI